MIKYLFIILAINFAELDRAFQKTGDIAAIRTQLEQTLPAAENDAEKAEVYWRISRACLLQGQEATTKKAKREFFAEGIHYAEEAIKADPNNPQGYLWRCTNTGRDAETRKLMEQAALAPKMSDDLATVLDKLGRTDCSEAWHTLAEIWIHHPFKSNDAAINFGRKAALTIPENDLRLVTLSFLAQSLYKRNWSAAQRRTAAASNAKKFLSARKNIDKYAAFDGAPQDLLRAPWNAEGLGALSDREEALAILEYAIGRFRACTSPTKLDQDDYKQLLSLKDQWK